MSVQLKHWVCDKCGHIHTGRNSPMICPECEADQDSFKYRKLTKEDYRKIRGLKKKMPDRADIIILGTAASSYVAAAIADHFGASVLMLEPSDVIGGGSTLGFSEKEEQAAHRNLRTDSSLLDKDDAYKKYKSIASEMLQMLGELEVLPQFKESPHDPLGDAHPWQEFSESTILETGIVNVAPESKRTLHHKLAHWATDSGVRVLLNQNIAKLIDNDDGEVGGVEVEFNDKNRTYYANMGIISFLNHDNLKLESKEEPSLSIVDTKNFVMTPAEKQFWGEEAFIGPIMVRAYKKCANMVKSSGLLD